MLLARRFLMPRVLVALAIGTLSVAPVLAQQRTGNGQMPSYNPSTEARLSGAVEEVITRSGYMGTLGTYLLMSFGDELLEVHLAPAVFLKQKYIEVIPGEMLEVIGSRVKMGDTDIIVAREIRNWEEMHWSFRDDSGKPLWTETQAR